MQTEQLQQSFLLWYTHFFFKEKSICFKPLIIIYYNNTSQEAEFLL